MRSTSTVLVIGRLEYTLSPFEDVGALKNALLAAAHAGTGAVTFRATGDVEVFAIISPGLTVVIEEREHTISDADHLNSDYEGDAISDFDMF